MLDKLRCWLYGHDWSEWHETTLYMDLVRWRDRDCRRCQQHQREELNFYSGK